jgi:hypothetical protein
LIFCSYRAESMIPFSFRRPAVVAGARRIFHDISGPHALQ